MFRGIVRGTGYQLHSPVSPSLPSRALPCAITFQLESTNLCEEQTALARSVTFGATYHVTW